MAASGFKVVSSEWARASRKQTWDFIVPVPLPDYFTGLKPAIPAISEVTDQTGDWNSAGQTRTIHLADGSHVHETIDEVETGSAFRYTVGPFNGPVGLLVKHAKGEFVFEDMAGGTYVRWSYTWVPKNGAAAPVVWALSKLWGVYANRVLVRLVQGAGSEA